MNEQEKYLFDLRGYLVVKNALSPAQVADLADRLEQHRSDDERPSESDRSRYPGGSRTTWLAPSLLEWGGTYVDLIDLPSIAPYLAALLGPDYRLDHDYIKIDNAAISTRLYLHGGGQGAGGATDLVGPTDGGQCFYRYNNGKFYNGLVAVGFELDTVPPGNGGFACVPGSHKVNFQLPPDWKISKTQDEMPECVQRPSPVTRSYSRRPASTARCPGRGMASDARSSTSTARTRWPGTPATTTPTSTINSATGNAPC